MNSTNLRLLHRYLNGDLEGREIDQFFQELEKSPEMRKALAEMSMDEILIAEVLLEDRAHTDSIDPGDESRKAGLRLVNSDSNEDRKKSPRRSTREGGIFGARRLGVLFVAGLLLGFGTVFAFLHRSGSSVERAVSTHPGDPSNEQTPNSLSRFSPRKAIPSSDDKRKSVPGQAPDSIVPIPPARHPMPVIAKRASRQHPVRTPSDTSRGSGPLLTKAVPAIGEKPLVRNKETPKATDNNVAPGQPNTVAAERARPVISLVLGAVALRGNATSVPAKIGAPLEKGVTITTSGLQSFAIVAFPDGTTLELGPDALLRILDPPKDGMEASHERGTLRAIVAPQLKESQFRIRTPNARIAVLGTRYISRVDKGGTTVDVESGSVRVTSRTSGRSVLVRAGHQAVVAGRPGLRVQRTLSRSLSFQDGLFPRPDYAGTRDTQLASNPSIGPRGKSTRLEVDRADATLGESLALLKWELPGTPPKSLVINATVTLHLSGDTSDTYDLYGVRGDWDEKHATWIKSSASRRWQRPGAEGQRDRQRAAIGTMQPQNAGQVKIQLNRAGLDLINNWIRAPQTNHGILIVARGDQGVGVRSREVVNPHLRPKLTIEYSVPASR